MTPQIKNDNGIPTLYVKGEPFFALAGELHNSSSSSLEYMERQVWPNLRGMNMNTVVLPLSWETIEPQEGEFDFSLVDGLIAQARKEQMHLVFLWFGLWKNSESMYVPRWMKEDTRTYFRAKKVNGEAINTISPLCAAAVEKDANAFAKVMGHIRKIDQEESTVILIQVENEIGLLGTERDYGEAANAAFAGPVPTALAQEYGKTGTWKEVFGEQAEEAFMAYYFASAVETITQAGQKEYPLPCYTNAWLYQYPWYPGSYPSGGPVAGVHRIWKCAAPSLFALAPDIYVPYVAQVMEEYSYEGNPLVVPEVRKDSVTASYCLYAFGHHNAICYSPFGIEDLALDPDSIEKPPMEVMMALNIDPSAMDITGSREYLAAVYGLLGQIKPLLLQYRGTSHLRSFVKKADTDFGSFFSFGEYNLKAAYGPKLPAKPLASGIVLEIAPHAFFLMGMQCTFEFMPKAGENVKAELLKMEEGTFENGQWKPGRILNGDEKMSIKCGDQIQCYYIELFKY